MEAKVQDPTGKRDGRYGTIVAPGVSGINHDHYFNYRLDLDVDGPQNSFEKLVYKTVALPASSPRRSIYEVMPEIPVREGPVRMSGHGPMKMRVINEARTNAMGYPVGYEIVHANHGHLIIDPRDWPAQRAAFLQSDVWLTGYDPAERYAAGDYVFASKGVQGLPVWARKNRPIRNADVVVWVNLGMHHYTRAEDSPVMPTLWHSFRLRPFNFFDRNPSLDLRTDFAK